MENELESGSVELSERMSEQFTGVVSNDVERILPVLCSIAISLKKIAEEANTATAAIRYDK